MSGGVPHEPIAVVGIGCRFPGGIDGPERFWRALCDGLDAVGEIPADRFDAEALYQPGAPVPGRIGTRWGGFLDGIDRFDAGFFGVSPREAESLDPQQRLLLETSWEALEDAGHPADALAGSRAGVFVGLWLHDYEARLFAGDEVDFHMTTGSGRYAASGRISYALGLQGPSLTVDTACSSSLVAVHLAVQSLRAGECEVALAGGANVILQPQITIAYSQSSMMAADGRCKFGDARGDGYVRSEGAAMVVLKPLSRALADGDRVYSVIRGSAVNNDGRSGEYMATPAQAGQEQMLRLAYRDAGVAPGRVQYVEAHGTGTAAGDPVELGALGAVLAEGRPEGSRCAVGSVKTNLGHTEGAAGVAGLIKAALVLFHREIPASLHHEVPSPAIAWDALPVFVPRERLPLRGAPAFAGVSAFGIAGTNAHVVLAEPPAHAPRDAHPSEDRATLVPLSARSAEALRALAGAYAEHLAASPDTALDDVAYTASRRRAHHAERLAVVASHPAELVERLRAFAAGEPGPGIAAGRRREPAPRVVFVFPGQGSQWVGMGRELLEREPVFRAAIEACEAAMRPFVDWSLTEQLGLHEDDERWRLDRIDVIQPTLVALDVALAALWRAWGVEPAAVVGHSMGEVAAAHVAGALDLEDAMRIICRRSQLLRRTSGRGAMAVVDLPRAAAEQALAGCEAQVAIAASNSPRTTILSGDPAALDRVLARLEGEGVFCRRVAVDVASHSPQMDPLREDLLAALDGLAPRAAAVPFYSTVAAAPLDGTALDAAYWERNLRQPVLFGETVERLLADGHDTFVEVSPHPVLLPAVQQTVQHAGADALALGSLRRGEPERATLLESLGALYGAGCAVDWAALHPRGELVPLPTYRWQKERYWHDAPARSQTRRAGAHPLLGAPLRAVTGAQLWESEIDTALAPWLADHRVRGRAVLPAAAYLEVALAAAETLEGAGALRLEGFAFEEAILPGDGETPAPQVQAVLEPDSAQAATLRLYSRVAGAAAGAWTRSARGRVVRDDAAAAAATIPAVAAAVVPGDEHYRAMAARGLDYGPAFRTIEAFSREDGRAGATVRLPEALHVDAARYRVHPALLDAALQLLLETIDAADPDGLYLPADVERVHVYGRPDPAAPLEARVRRAMGTNDLTGDAYLLDDAGRLIVALEGVRFRRLPRERDAGPADWLYAVAWEPRPRAVPADAPAGEPGAWLVLADAGGVAEALAARLEAAGDVCGVVASEEGAAAGRDALRRRIVEAASGEVRLRGVVDLRGVDAGGAGIGEALPRCGLDALYLAQALAAAAVPSRPRLVLVTRGAQPVAAAGAAADVPAPGQAPRWGLASVVAQEHPELGCLCVDLDPEAPVEAAAEALLAELRAPDGEDRVGIRRGERYAMRLVRHSPDPDREATAHAHRADPRAAESYRVVSTGAGVLENLRLEPAPRRRPRAGEVEIEVRATGLNFMNVMSALGVYPGYPNGLGPLGIECAGVVAAVGEGVDEFEVGDEAVAFAHDCLARHVRADARLVARRPAGLDFAQAATLPIAFLTAHYALAHLGRLAAGERVLIHSATGGVGLAAIQLARRIGAEIFATAGSEAKRDQLRALGIPHVYDSRSLDFADRIREATGGEGVDVVLNSLAGEAIGRGLELLRPYGRFLELGKRDIHDDSRIGLGAFRNQLSYFAIDLDRGAHERPALLGGMLREIVARVAAGELEPLPHRVFPAAEVVDAFRHMAQARHTGKVVVEIPAPAELGAALPAPATPIRGDATYLVTGGLGGIGLEVARWMVNQGARHLVLVGRSAPSDAARATIDELEADGATIRVEQADVSRVAEIERVLAGIDRELPPLRGVVHAAGVLADATLLELDAERWTATTAAKIDGAWNLHRLTLDAPLDLFVLFSSVAPLLGTAGQANYAAANAFLDALAHHRRAQELPALSIAWGPWTEIGLAAARADRGARLAAQGLGGLAPAQGIAALTELLRVDTPPHRAVMRFDVARWCAAHPAAAAAPLFERLREAEPAAQASPPATSGIRAALAEAPSARTREELLQAHLRERAAQVLRLAPGRVALRQPLKELGLDSLMSLELRNRLEADLGVAVPAVAIWNYPTVAQLARYLNGEMEDAPAGEARLAEEARVETAAAAAARPITVEGLGREQVEALLERELAEIDELLSGD